MSDLATAHVNITACRIRLTGVTNAADALLQVVENLVADLPALGAETALNTALAEYGVNLDQIRRNLNTAIIVARGASDVKLPQELFKAVADRGVVNAGQHLGLIEQE